MPGQGTTRRKCMVCHTDLNVACKTCNTCKKEQPHKLRLEKKLQKFDQKKESWVQMQKKNRTTSHIQDEAVLLLEKLQALGLRGVLLLSKPGKKPNNWVSEVLAPRCQLSETSHTCLERIKAMYDIVIQGWSPQVIQSLSAPVEPPTGRPMVISDQQETVVLLNPPTAPTGPPATLIGPPKSPIEHPMSSLAPPVKQSQNLGKRPHSPVGPSEASPVSFEKDEVVEGGCPAPTIVRPNKRKVKVVKGGCPAPATVRPKKRKECPHTVTGSQGYYPVKSVAKYKVIKGQKWKQVEWEPCKLWVPQSRSWRATTMFSSNSDQTHMGKIINVFRICRNS